MTAPAKTQAATTPATPATSSRPTNADRTTLDTDGSGSETSLEALARAQEELTHEIRQLVARQVLDSATDDDHRDHAGHLVTVARADLLEQLRDQEQEQARRQLARATQSSEDAVDGVVRSVTLIVRALVPTAMVRPEDLIEAAYTVADQGLRVSRRFALSVSSSVRNLSAAV